MRVQYTAVCMRVQLVLPVAVGGREWDSVTGSMAVCGRRK